MQDILQKAANITHLLRKTRELEASVSTEDLICMVEGSQGNGQRTPTKEVVMANGRSVSATQASGVLDEHDAAPARSLQGLYNLEACGFPLHIPKQYLAQHWEFWKENFRNRLTFPRYMCFNRYLTKEHLEDLIVRDPERWQEVHSFSRALSNGIPAFKMVKYLETAAERAPYRVHFKNGKCYDYKGSVLDTGDMMSGKMHVKAAGRNASGKGYVWCPKQNI